jgi:hypothetical protein
MRNFTDRMRRNKIGPVPFEEIEIGMFRLSIQAGSNYACEPRIDNLPPEEYNTFEIAIYPAIPVMLNLRLQQYNTNGILRYVPKNMVQLIVDTIADLHIYRLFKNGRPTQILIEAETPETGLKLINVVVGHNENILTNTINGPALVMKWDIIELKEEYK